MAVTSISVTYYETTEFGSEPITPEQAAAYESCYEERLDARLREWYPEAEIEVTFRRGVGTDRTYVDADSRQEAEAAELSIDDLTGTLFLECLDVALAEAPSVECDYCRRELDQQVAESVPDVYDDEAWDRLARLHRDDCEWIETRAHRRFWHRHLCGNCGAVIGEDVFDCGTDSDHQDGYCIDCERNMRELDDLRSAELAGAEDEPVYVGYVLTESGRILVQIPADDAPDFVLADDEQTWPGGHGIASRWEPLASNDPRITAEDRERLGWILTEHCPHSLDGDCGGDTPDGGHVHFVRGGSGEYVVERRPDGRIVDTRPWQMNVG